AHSVPLDHLFFLPRHPPPPRSPLFPYTTLFRSSPGAAGGQSLASSPATSAASCSTSAFALQAVCVASNSRAKRKGLDLMTSAPRSEEHTSELQSRRDLVCRLLLEKKKKK